ncbi:hypothetical protein [Pseudomonas syringae]|uniref:hypothetical protein n=1 Tax=Pseudomonas syringae TaxID=317 RepID=UPI00217FBA5F|nr:hypothetical protein [Pseudomonas syringae]
MKSNIFPIDSHSATTSATGAPDRLPAQVEQAMACDWGVFVDAYLCNGAKVGDRYAATAYFAQSGEIPNGITVATHQVRLVATQGAFKLFQTLNGADHYVIVSEHSVEDHDDDDA